MSKFGNIPTNVGGKSFASRLEAGRYQELCALEDAGKISDLRTQVTYRLDVNGMHVCKYISDFVYLDEHGKEIVEDTKGFITPEFSIKKKLMLACLGIDIQLVFAKRKFVGKRRFGGGN